MKISEVVQALQEIQASAGDIPVYVSDSDSCIAESWKIELHTERHYAGRTLITEPVVWIL
jgi:hypothetical protein